MPSWESLAGRIEEDDGVGFKMAGDVGGGDFVGASLEVEIVGGADDGEVLTVESEGYRAGSHPAGLVCTATA
jgi:hypothetical protein